MACLGGGHAKVSRALHTLKMARMLDAHGFAQDKHVFRHLRRCLRIMKLEQTIYDTQNRGNFEIVWV